MGFVCKNGVCKSAGPDEKSECFSSTKHEPNEIHDYYRKFSPSVHNNSHHRIRHRKNHQKHRDKHHHPHTTTTTPTTSTTTSTTTTTTTTSTTTTTTTTPQPFKRKNKKKSKLSRKKSRPLKKIVTSSDFVTPEILSTVYSSSASYQPDEASSSSSSSSSLSFDVEPTGASASASSSSISSIMDSSSYGATDPDPTDISSTNIPVSPNKLSSTTEFNNNYLITSNKNMNRNKNLRKHHPQSTISTLTTLEIVPTATLFTDISPTTDWDVISSTDYTSESEAASSSSPSSYYFNNNNNELSDFVSTEFNLKSSTLSEDDFSSTSSVFYLPDPQVPTSSTLVARKKNFLNNFSSAASEVEQNASTSLRKLLEIEEK